MVFNFSMPSWFPKQLKKSLQKSENEMKEMTTKSANVLPTNKLKECSGDDMKIVDGLKFVKHGSFAMVLNGKDTSPLQCSKKKEWKFCHISDDNCWLYFGPETAISVEDVERIDALTDVELVNVKDDLQSMFDNCSSKGQEEIDLISLKCLMFAVHFKYHNNGLKRSSVVYLLWDCYQTAYIWFRISKVITCNHFSSSTWKKEKKTSLSYSLLISNRLRVGNSTLLDTMSNHRNDANGVLFVHFVHNQLSLVARQIDEMSQFATRFCILDSSWHLSLLSQTKDLSKQLIRVTNLIKELEEERKEGYDSEEQMSDLFELWQCLQANITGCFLKWIQFKSDITL